MRLNETEIGVTDHQFVRTIAMNLVCNLERTNFAFGHVYLVFGVVFQVSDGLFVLGML